MTLEALLRELPQAHNDPGDWGTGGDILISRVLGRSAESAARSHSLERTRKTRQTCISGPNETA